MGLQTTQKEEKYIDIEDLLKESLSDKSITGDKEDMVLEYLCQTISKTDSYDILKKKADQGDSYAYIQLASWHIAHARNIKDYCAAYYYAVKASRQGYVEAYYILGQLYLYGTGCIKNVRRGIKYLDAFVTNVSEKELLNSSVLADAYLKLATAEKALGHYERAYQYYRKLQNLDSAYDEEVKEVLLELQDTQNEHASYLIYASVAFLVLCAAVYFISSHLSEQYHAYAGRYKIGEKVTIIEEEKPAEPEPVVTPAETIPKPLAYQLVTQEEFDALSLSKLAVSEISATSEYISKKGNYFGADNLLDAGMDTSWQEGEEDGGIGQSIRLTLAAPAVIRAMCIYNGKQTGTEAFYENNRVASFTVFDNLLVELPDDMEPQYIVFDNPPEAGEVIITLQSVFSGIKWNDTCITQIILYE